MGNRQSCIAILFTVYPLIFKTFSWGAKIHLCSYFRFFCRGNNPVQAGRLRRPGRFFEVSAPFASPQGRQKAQKLQKRFVQRRSLCTNFEKLWLKESDLS